MLGGYFYYRRFGYTSGKGKLFRPASYSTENISQANLTPHHTLSLSHSNLHNTNNQHNLNEPRNSNQEIRPSGGGGGIGHVNNGFNFGEFDNRDQRQRDTVSRVERTT